ncbi:DNA primase [Pseudomonas putida]|uniref:DNA primase n=1 Tax=Pseudomonas putida TaxID=303 RepID=A0A8I1EAL9_PSEPU|nr:DNA primase [Pseudomonas putida]
MADPKLMRIPQDVIDDLVVQTDIVDTIGGFIKLKKTGKDFSALCPFHKESSPSFTVNPERQFYYCFGCGAGGNTMNFLNAYQGRSFLSVLQDMADAAGVDLTPFLKSAQGDNQALLILPAINEAKRFFVEALRDEDSGAKAAREYLHSRGITEEMWDLFAIGYAGNGQRVVEALLEHQGALIEAGIVQVSKEGDKGWNGTPRAYSMFRNRVVMPIRDTRGKTIAITGRTLSADVKPKYLNSKETSYFSKNNVLYGLYESIQKFGTEKLKHLIVAEGQTDVIANIMANKAACGAMGSSMSAQQLRLLIRHGERITFVFDGDKAGRKALLQVCTLLLENLTDMDTSFDVAVLPEGEDPDSMIKENLAAYDKLIDEATPWMDAMLEYLPTEAPIDSDKGRSEFSVAAVELAYETRDPLLRYQLIEKAGKKVSIPVEALNERLLSFKVSKSGQTVKPQRIMNDSIVRLIRMWWDSPEWSESLEHPQLWSDEGDELTSLMGVWVLEMRNGNYDLPFSDEELAGIANNHISKDKLALKKRYQGAGMALARLLGEQEPHVMQLIMQEEPEENRSVSRALAWHVTSLCAGKAMQDLSTKAAAGGMQPGDLERSIQLQGIRKVAMQKTRTIET